MKKWKYWNKRRWETCWNASLEEPAGFDSRLVTTYILEYSTSCLHMITLDNRADDHVMTIMKANLKWIILMVWSVEKVPGWFFMFFSRFQVGSSWFQVGFLWFRAVFMFFMVLNEKSPKGTRLICILAPRSRPLSLAGHRFHTNFHGPGRVSWFQVGFCGFSWFQVGFS